MPALVCCGNWPISCTRTDSVTCEQVTRLELKPACWFKAGVTPFAAGLSVLPLYLYVGKKRAGLHARLFDYSENKIQVL